MGKVKTFELTLADNKSVYYPGDLVTGRCILELKSEIRFRTVRVCMRGVAKVHWTESRSTGTRLGAYTEHFNSELEYFNKKQLLYGNDDSKADLTALAEGKYQFTFAFELPFEGLSTSFEGKHGSIRYWLKGEVDKPWSFNYRTKKAFTVISPIDINTPPYLAPVANSVDKSVCCCFCRSGSISIDARTDRRGYCPGESIALLAEFDNQSNRTIIPYASLHQVQTFLAKGKSRVRVSKFTTLTGLHINGRSQSSWDGLMLKIPAVPPTVANCLVIRVEYFVKIALHIPASSNLCMLLPITIGTMPFRRRQHNQIFSISSQNPSLSLPQVPSISSPSSSSSSSSSSSAQRQLFSQWRPMRTSSSSSHPLPSSSSSHPLSLSSSSLLSSSSSLHPMTAPVITSSPLNDNNNNNINNQPMMMMMMVMMKRRRRMILEPPSYNEAVGASNNDNNNNNNNNNNNGNLDHGIVNYAPPPEYIPSDSRMVDIRDEDELGRGWTDDDDHVNRGDGDRRSEGRYLFRPMYAYVRDYIRPPAYSEVDPHPQNNRTATTATANIATATTATATTATATTATATLATTTTATTTITTATNTISVTANSF